MSIKQLIESSISVKQALLKDQHILAETEAIASLLVNCFQAKGKVLFCGNGGSAADSLHLSAELSGRFYLDRPPLFAEALQSNTAYLTAVANDYSFDHIFARAVHAKGREGDVLWALSTSGNSPNIIQAIEAAKEIGMHIVGMTGKDGGKMLGMCDLEIVVPSNDTPRIQEVHLLLGHIICELVEKKLFG